MFQIYVDIYIYIKKGYAPCRRPQYDGKQFGYRVVAIDVLQLETSRATARSCLLIGGQM